jgi:glycosyltransferase involved in cell wall biosynthesis
MLNTKSGALTGMKISFIMDNPDGHRFDSNSSSHITRTMNLLKRIGHEITVIEYKHQPTDLETLSYNGLTIVRLSVAGFDQSTLHHILKVRIHSLGWMIERLLFALTLGMYLRKKSYDVICFYETLTVLLLTFFFPYLKKKIVLHSILLINEENHGWYYKIQLRLLKIAAKKIKRIIIENAIGQRSFAQFVKNPEISCKIATIEPGVDTVFWGAYRSKTLSKKILKKKGEIVILFHARLVKRKGPEYLIKAANILINCKGHKNLHFIFVGPPEEAEAIVFSNKNSSYVRHLSRLIESFGLRGSVRLVAEWLSEESLRDYFSIADIYVLPTLYDMSPHTIKQAMAMGIPIISTRVGWIPSMVEEGVNGFLIQPKDPVSLADSIERLINNQDLRRVIGENNMKKAKEQWSLEQEAKRFESAFYG